MILNSHHSFYSMCFTDKNIPGADGAMKAARDTCEWFNKSTQGVSILLQFQDSSDIQRYVENGKALNVIQDVITRWWSSWRMLKRLRFLKPAIMSLKVTGRINCDTPSDDQWIILYQIEVALEPMAKFQRMLEGQCYVTGSMVVFAVWRVRLEYMAVIGCEDTLEPVRKLTEILLKDFNQRYMPADVSGKVQYTSEVELGFMNRHVGVHPFYFVAAFLDPRMKGILHSNHGTSSNQQEFIMVDAEYEKLKSDVLAIMVSETKDIEKKKKNDGDKKGATKANKAAGEDEEEAITPPAKRRKLNDVMFGGMGRMNVDKVTPQKKKNDTTIRIECQKELDLFIVAKGVPIIDEKGDYVNPLEWWMKHEDEFPVLAYMAQAYLSIPATSAPSERIWSRAAQVYTANRSRLDPDIASGIIFTKENLPLLRKHWAVLTKNRKDMPPLHLSGLPMPEPEDDEAHIDVGQDLFDKNMDF